MRSTKEFSFFYIVLFLKITVSTSVAQNPSIIHGALENGTTNPSPKIEVFLPVAKERTDIGVIIFPGGGYRGLAEHEGAGYAHFFQSKGIAAFVVEYRLGGDGHRHPAMLEDALAAIQTVRTQAAEFGIDPQKLGVMGSSAGGHLTAHTLTSYGELSEWNILVVFLVEDFLSASGDRGMNPLLQFLNQPQFKRTFHHSKVHEIPFFI